MRQSSKVRSFLEALNRGSAKRAAKRRKNTRAASTLAEVLEEKALLSGVTGGLTQVDADLAGQVVRQEVVFVDANVEGAEQLIADFEANTPPGTALTVVALDANRNGVTQISETLAGLKGLDAVHILSHGNDATLRLGNTAVDDSNFATYAAEIANWGQSLSENADVLLYGCDFASTDAGQQMLESIATLTAADVAASDDLTGAASLGGDWDLEVRVGQVEAATLQSANFAGTLNLRPTVDLDGDDSGTNPGTFDIAEVTSASNTGESVSGTLGNGTNASAQFTVTRGVRLGVNDDITVDVVSGTDDTIEITLADDATSPEANEGVRVSTAFAARTNTNISQLQIRQSPNQDMKAGELTLFFEGSLTLHDPDNQVSSDADGDTILTTDALIFDDAVAGADATWWLELNNPQEPVRAFFCIVSQ